VGLPAHVALDILRQLDARDLCALRATCRAFDFPLVETAAAEACRALAPWLTAPHPGESWVQLLRFAELSERARLPRLVAGEDVTAVVDRAGHLHAWGPVVDVFGEDTSRSPEPSRDASSPSPSPSPRPPRRVTCAAAGRAFVAAAGVGGAPLAILRNAAGIEAALGGASPSLLGRPPRTPGTLGNARVDDARLPRASGDDVARRVMRSPKPSAFANARVVSVALGRLHVIAATERGAAYTWGGDAAGQLGHGSVRESVALARLALGGSPRSGSTRGDAAAHRRRNRRRKGGGDDRAGGGYESPSGSRSPAGRPASPASSSPFGSADADAARRWSKPRRVASLANRFVAGVAAAPHSSAARTDAGVLFAWGSNRHGILGVGDDLDRDEPARVALRLKTGGRGRGWGRGRFTPSPGGRFPGAMSDTESDDGDDFDSESNSGEDGSRDARDGSVPVPVPGRGRDGASSDSLSDSLSDSETDDGEPDGVVSVAFGARHALAITASGTLYAWGDNRSWQCGERRSVDPERRAWPAPVAFPDDDDGVDDDDANTLEDDDDVVTFRRYRDARRPRVASAAGGDAHSIACDTAGRVWVFGDGDVVGAATIPPGARDATPAPRLVGPPARARGFPSVVDVAAGKNHVAVMTAEGEVYAWGAGRPVARAGAFARGES